MPIDHRLLDLLCCPVSKLPLALAQSADLEALHQAAAAGQLLQRDGQRVPEAPRQALVERRGGWFYPVLDDIPVLLPDAGLRIGTLPSTDVS